MRVKNVYPRTISLPIKVMWISNSIHLPTGYANVTKSICTELAKDTSFKIYTVGMQHSGKPEQIDNLINMGIVQNQVFDSIQNHINSIKPNVIIILEDPFTMTNNNFHKLNLNGAKLIVYYPLDGMNTATGTLPIHRQADLNIGMAEFGSKQLETIGFESTTIWHGVDIDKYKPVSKKIQSKIKLLNGFNDTDVIFYSYFRNSGRKTPQTHLEIMASILAELPDNYKYLVQCINADDQQNNLIDFKERILCDQYGKSVTDRIIINHETLSDDTMVQYMQMADYVIHASSGEGAGLLMYDALACGKLCFANNYSTTHEMLFKEYDDIGQRGILIDPAYYVTSTYNVEHGHADKDEFKTIILDFIKNDGDKTLFTGNARLFAEKYLSWQTITNQFKEKIKQVI